MSLLPEPEKRKALRGHDYDHEGFEAFWKDYPRHEARKDAIKAWNSLKPSRETQGKIIAALAWQRELRHWQQSKQFIPLPATYLRGERWTDESPRQSIASPQRPGWCQHIPTCESVTWHMVAMTKEREAAKAKRKHS